MRASVVVVLLLLAVPATAVAGDATVQTQQCVRADCSGGPRYQARPGEANALEVTRQGPATTFRDTVAIRAGAGCQQVDERTARCVYEGPEAPEVNLLDRDDRLDVPAGGGSVAARLGEGHDVAVGASRVAGQGGADRLVAGPAGAALDGGAGDDELRGGPGVDWLTGGAGRDLYDGGAGDDVLMLSDGAADVGATSPAPELPDAGDAGPGRDELSWAETAAGIVVDLADPGPDGPPAAPDAITGGEDVTGTREPDRIAGDDGPNALFGVDGADALAGRGGDDRLDAGFGASRGARLDAGPGDDLLRGTQAAGMGGGPGDDALTVHGTAGPRAVQRCGGGADRVFSTADVFALRRDCEGFDFPEGLSVTVQRPIRRSLGLVARCASGCRGRVVVRPVGRARWRSSVALPRSLRRPRRLVLPLRGARALRLSWGGQSLRLAVP
jgi:Ca2+-binding RTX toxin-like protein